jgi:LEA14-like dessication related protein
MSTSQKRFTLIILGAFTMLLVLASLSGCETLQSQVEQPTVKLAGISLVEAGLVQQVYGVTLEVENPNGFTLPIKGVNYAVKVGGQEFATGLTPSGFSIPAKGSNQVQVEVRTNLLESISHLGRMLSGNPKELDYELSGDIQIDMPLVGPIPFNQAGTIPLTRGANVE